MDLADFPPAVRVLQEKLQELGGACSIWSLSAHVKWGQGELGLVMVEAPTVSHPH